MNTMATKAHTAVPLMEIVSGFRAFKTLAAAVELNLFSMLSGKGVDTREAGQLLGLHPRPAEMLLSACTALGLLVKRAERYLSQLSDSVRG